MNINQDNSLLIIIDMNNGFAHQGALYSPNVEALIKPIEKLMREFAKKDIPMIHYTDCHNENDEEFNFFPKHCLKGNKESKIVDELLINNAYIIPKTTTDGFKCLNPFKIVPLQNRDIYVCGCVTDICVKNFILSVLEYFQINRLTNKVYVFENLVATFDMENHPSEVYHKDALKEMALRGAQIIKY